MMKKFLSLVVALVLMAGLLTPLPAQAANALTVTFSPNGGDPMLPGNGERTVVPDRNIGAVNMPINPTRGGYVFLTWNTAPDGSGTAFTGTTIVWNNITVYAQWGITLQFNGSGSTLNIGTNPNSANDYTTRTLRPGATVNATPGIVWPNDPAWPGYTFMGWYTVTVAEGIMHYHDRHFGNTPIETSVVLFARWQLSPIRTVTFNPAGGAIHQDHSNIRRAGEGISIHASWNAPQNLNHGILWPQSAPRAERPNMTIEGWWTATGGPNGGGTRFAFPGRSHTAPATSGIFSSNEGLLSVSDTVVRHDMTVYAHWVYRVTFSAGSGGQWASGSRTQTWRDVPIVNGTVNANGLFIEGATASQDRTPGMPPNPNRTGFNFLGWFDAAGNEFTGNTPVSRSQVVNARWEALPVEMVTITFMASGGLFGSSATSRTFQLPTGQSFSSMSGPESGPELPTRDGFVFTGWYTQEGERFTRNVRYTSDKTFYTDWQPYHTVTFISCDGVTVPLRVASGFRVSGMNSIWDSSFSTTSLRYAYSVNSSFFFLSPFLAARTTASGYTFREWNTRPDGRGEVFNNIVTKDMNAYAVWTVRLTFSNNHSSVAGGITDVTVINHVALGESVYSSRQLTRYASQTNISNDRIVWPCFTAPNWTGLATLYLQWQHLYLQGWALVGFNSASDGSGQWINADTPITEPTTVFAIWSPGVIFHSGAAPSDVILPENRERLIDRREPLDGRMPPDPLWPGQIFNSWNTHRDGSGRTYTRETPINIGTTLHAVWNATITFDANGGTPALNTAVVLSGNPIRQSFPAPPAREGYMFMGWFSEQEGGIQYTANAPVVERSVTLYAHWLAGGHPKYTCCIEYSASPLNAVPALTFSFADAKAAGNANEPKIPAANRTAPAANTFLDIIGETLTVGSSFPAIQAFSIDGGKKWKVGDLDAIKLTRLLNKNLDLWLCFKDYNTNAKVPQGSGEEHNIIAFPSINRRTPAPKLRVNYLIGANEKSCHGDFDGQWVLIDRNEPTAAVKQNIQIGTALVLPNGKAGKTVDAQGWGRFHHRSATGICVHTLPDSGKPGRHTYFIRTEPSDNGDGTFTAGSRARRVRVTSQLKRPNYKVNKGDIRIRANTWVIISNDNNGVPRLREKGNVGLENTAGTVILWQGAKPNGRRAASAKQTVTLPAPSGYSMLSPLCTAYLPVPASPSSTRPTHTTSSVTGRPPGYA